MNFICNFSEFKKENTDMNRNLDLDSFVFSYEHKCSPENSEKSSLAFRFISLFLENINSIQFFYILNYFISNNIALFGGIVRDIILFNSILPEHCNDIDCIMSEKQYNNLFIFLHKNKINFKFNGYIRDEYIPFEDPNNYIIEFTTIQISNTFSIDIFVHKNDANIYDVMDIIVGKNIDFYCNSLRYVNNKISINNELIEKFLLDKKLLYDFKFDINIILSIYFHENKSFNEISNNIIVLHNIINQIKNKISVSIDKPDKHRIEKMIYKKWLII